MDKQYIDKQLRVSIRSFRLGKESRGSQSLKNVIDQILPELVGHEADLQETDLKLLQDILSAQVRGDVLYIADLLEYEFPCSFFGKKFLS
jgi:hypothetical protein